MPNRLRQAAASIQIDRLATQVAPHDRLTKLRELGARRLGHATDEL
jgi:hypothetical protein